MSGRPVVSVVVAPSAHGGRLPRTVRSALASIAACGRNGEVVIGLASADALLRSAAAGLAGVRAELVSTATTHAAARAARGSIAVLVQAGDLLPEGYVHALIAAVEADGEAVLRPDVVVSYGGAPSTRRQTALRPTPDDRARVVFSPPFAPPIAVRTDLLLRLPNRSFDLAADWRWTLETVGQGIRHEIALETTYVVWTPMAPPPVFLPAATGYELDPSDELGQARAELAALRGSTSWRITRPLRTLISLARGGR